MKPAANDTKSNDKDLLIGLGVLAAIGWLLSSNEQKSRSPWKSLENDYSTRLAHDTLFSLPRAPSDPLTLWQQLSGGRRTPEWSGPKSSASCSASQALSLLRKSVKIANDLHRSGDLTQDQLASVIATLVQRFLDDTSRGRLESTAASPNLARKSA
jgi:hypothetical protein